MLASEDSMAFHYIDSFDAEARDRIFRFLVLFARWECALKHGGFAKGARYGQAEADWNCFARKYPQRLAGFATRISRLLATDFLFDRREENN